MLFLCLEDPYLRLSFHHHCHCRARVVLRVCVWLSRMQLSICHPPVWLLHGGRQRHNWTVRIDRRVVRSTMRVHLIKSTNLSFPEKSTNYVLSLLLQQHHWLFSFLPAWWVIFQSIHLCITRVEGWRVSYSEQNTLPWRRAVEVSWPGQRCDWGDLLVCSSLQHLLLHFSKEPLVSCELHNNKLLNTQLHTVTGHFSYANHLWDIWNSSPSFFSLGTPTSPQTPWKRCLQSFCASCPSSRLTSVHPWWLLKLYLLWLYEGFHAQVRNLVVAQMG